MFRPARSISPNTASLLKLWGEKYDLNKQFSGMTYSKVRYYQRVNASVQGLLSTEPEILATKDPQTGALTEAGEVNENDYINISQVANVRVLPLGTDNFGRDVLTVLVKATGVSLEIGLIAGLVATAIGLTLGCWQAISAAGWMTLSCSSPTSSPSSPVLCC